jgi:hypothetical protein
MDVRAKLMLATRTHAHLLNTVIDTFRITHKLVTEFK